LARGGVITLEHHRIKFEYVAIPYAKQEVIGAISELKFPRYEMINRYFFGADSVMDPRSIAIVA